MATDLTPISNVTLYGGAPLHIALDGHDSEGDALTYTVTTSNSLLSANVLSGNRSLKMSVEGYGDMIFELFEQEAPRTTARIIELVQSGFYDGLTFHRIIEDFMIQGGDPSGDGTGGSGTDFDDEFNALLQHTSSGILSMAKSSDDTNDSQFFITADATRHLDFNHTIFGFLTEGDSVREAIASVEVGGTSGTTPVEDVVIDSMSVFVGEENGLLRLSAPDGTVGNTVVTVTATDSHGNSATQQFTVYIRQDSTDTYPFLGEMSPIYTSGTTPVSFTIPATDVEGDAIVYGGRSYNEDSHLAVSVNATTGAVTITPNGVPGVYGVDVYVRADEPADYYSGRDVWDLQAVPVYVLPSKPVVEILSGSDTGSSDHDGITSLNNTGGHALQFRVSNVVAGAQVTLYADGQVIGQTTVGTGSTSVVVETDGTYSLSDGQHTITAVQTVLDVTADIGNEHIDTDLASPTSDALVLVVDATPPQITSAAVLVALEGRRYVYDVQSNEEAGGGLTYELLQAPAGMAIANPQNGKIAWLPGSGQGGSHEVRVRATDKAGNSTEQSFVVSVAPAARILPLDNRSTDEGTPVSFTVQTESDDGMLPLTFRLTQAPDGATIDPTTGVFHWTPSEAQGPGQHTVTVEVETAAGVLSWASLTISVAETNQAPTLAEIRDQVVAEHELLELDFVAVDPDLPANALVFELLGAPEGAQVDPATGQFRWRPGEDDGGREYTMTVRVTDSAGAQAERSFTVRVDEVYEVFLDQVLPDVNRSPDRLSRLAAEALLNATTSAGARAATETSAAAAADGGLFGNQLLGDTIGASTGASGDPTLQPPDEGKANRKAEEPQPDRTKAIPADQQKDVPPDKQDQRQSSLLPGETPPKAHDLAVEALVEEAEALIFTEPEQPGDVAEAELPVTAAALVENAEEAPMEAGERVEELECRMTKSK